MTATAARAKTNRRIGVSPLSSRTLVMIASAIRAGGAALSTLRQHKVWAGAAIGARPHSRREGRHTPPSTAGGEPDRGALVRCQDARPGRGRLGGKGRALALEQ